MNINNSWQFTGKKISQSYSDTCELFQILVTPVVQFPYDVVGNFAVPTAVAVTVSQGEAVIPISLDPPNPQEAGGQMDATPSTSQVPITDPDSVPSSQPRK